MQWFRWIYVYVGEYANILNYHNNAERVLRLSTQWRQGGGRCPPQFVWLFLFVASMYGHIIMLPFAYLLRSWIGQELQVMMGNFTIFFGLRDTFKLVVFIIAFPIPLIKLLLYPYLSTNNYDSLLFVKHRITEQLALPPSQRDKQFKVIHYTYVSLIILFALGIALFIIFYCVVSVVYAFEHADYFIAGWLGPPRFLILLVMMLHVDSAFLFLFEVYGQMFISIFYASVYTFKDLDNSSGLLTRQPFRWSDLERFRHQHTLIVTRVFRMNSILGNILLLFYLANYPTNAYFLIYVLAKGSGPFVIKLMIVFYMCHQFCFIIAIHLLAASYR